MIRQVPSPLRMWRFVLLMWLLALGGVVGFGPPSFGDGDLSSAPVGSTELAALAAVPAIPSSVGSVAAIVVDAATGHPLLASNADTRLAPASLTKMMTALVALDRAQPADIITASARSLTEPITVGLDPGDRLTLDDMLYGLLLPSGNDAALAIAETVGGGSIDRFVDWMNERAQRMRLKNTHFANPTGLDEKDHFSSARDLAQIARALMEEPRLARIVGTARHVVPGPPLYAFRNSNPLLGSMAGVDGIKTGFTDEAGRCLAASVVQDGHRLISVVLDSRDIAIGTRSLVEAAFSIAIWTKVEMPWAGLGMLRVAGASAAGVATVALAGWEGPFLHGFAARESQAWVGRRPLVRWLPE